MWNDHQGQGDCSRQGRGQIFLQEIRGQHQHISIGPEALLCAQVADSLEQEFRRRHDLEDMERRP